MLGSQKQVGVLLVNVPQRGGGLLTFVMMSNQISTLSWEWGGGGGGSEFYLIRALFTLFEWAIPEIIHTYTTDGFLELGAQRMGVSDLGFRVFFENANFLWTSS